MKADAIVIGSGVSGLTAAAILAKKRKKVIVVESHKNPGGALKRFSRKGVPFDVGFHYTGCLGDGEILSCLWEYLGVLPKVEVSKFPENGCDLLKIRDTNLSVHNFFSYQKLISELLEVFPEEEKAINAYFYEIKKQCDNIPFYNLKLPLTPFLRGFFDQGQSLGSFLKSITKNKSLQAVLASPAFLYGVSPANAGLAVHASVSHGFYSGAYAVKGGGQAIVEAYLDIFKQYDVNVLTSAEVNSLDIDNGLIKGIQTDDLQIEAPVVIYTGHPSSLVNLVHKENFRPAFRHRLEDLKNTDSMFIVFGTTDNLKLARKLQWQNLYSLNAGLDLLEVDAENIERNSILLTSPGLRDYDRSLPEKRFPVIVMRPAKWAEIAKLTSSQNRKRTTGYLDWKKLNCNQLINSAAKYFDFSPDDILTLTSGSPLTFFDELKAPAGAVYGPQFCLGQYNPIARTKIGGLFLAGQGTLMPGIVGASLSGMVAAGETDNLESLWAEVINSR